MPVGVKAFGVPVTVAVSCTVVPSATGLVMAVLVASLITVAVLEVPWLTVSGSTGLVEP